MPCIATQSCPWIFERAVLQSLFAQAKLLSVADEFLAIRRNQVSQTFAAPQMVVQPQAAIHRVNHPVATALKLSNLELFSKFCHSDPAHAGPCAIGR